RALLVRDGFHFFAFLLPVVWLLFHRLWIEAAAAFVIALGIGAFGTYPGIGTASSVLGFLAAMLLGMEAASLKLAALRRRGWREWGVVEAANADEAELRFVTCVASDETERPEAASTAVPAHARPRLPSGPALGMLGYPARG